MRKHVTDISNLKYQMNCALDKISHATLSELPNYLLLSSTGGHYLNTKHCLVSIHKGQYIYKQYHLHENWLLLNENRIKYELVFTR